MAQTPTPRSVLRTKIDGIAQAARVGKCESGSLLHEDVAELLTLISEGDAAKSLILISAKTRTASASSS